MEAFATLFATTAAGSTAIAAPALLAATGPELLFGTAAAAAGTAVTGAATAGALASAFSFRDVLGGVFDTVSTISGVLGQRESTQAQVGQQLRLADDLRIQSLQIGNQARLDEIRAIEDLRARISASIVNTFAAGLAPTGSVESGIEEAIRQQEFETTVGGRDARIRQIQLELEANAAESSVTAIQFAGLSNSGTRLFATTQRLLARG